MKLDWRRGIIYSSSLGMGACWLYAFVLLLDKQAAGGSLPAGWLLAVLPVSFAVNFWLGRLRWRRIVPLAVSWVVWLVVMLLMVKTQMFGSMAWSDPAWLLSLPRAVAGVLGGFRPELLIVICSAVIWWVGRHLAYMKAGFSALVSEFQFGIVLLVIAFFIGYQLKIEIDHSVYVALLFFFFALLGISISHALEGSSWLSGLYQGHWLGLLLVSIGMVLVIGLLVSSFITPDLLQRLLAVLKWLWALV